MFFYFNDFNSMNLLFIHLKSKQIYMFQCFTFDDSFDIS